MGRYIGGWLRWCFNFFPCWLEVSFFSTLFFSLRDERRETSSQSRLQSKKKKKKKYEREKNMSWIFSFTASSSLPMHHHTWICRVLFGRMSGRLSFYEGLFKDGSPSFSKREQIIDRWRARHIGLLFFSFCLALVKKLCEKKRWLL